MKINQDNDVLFTPQVVNIGFEKVACSYHSLRFLGDRWVSQKVKKNLQTSTLRFKKRADELVNVHFIDTLILTVW